MGSMIPMDTFGWKSMCMWLATPTWTTVHWYGNFTWIRKRNEIPSIEIVRMVTLETKWRFKCRDIIAIWHCLHKALNCYLLRACVRSKETDYSNRCWFGHYFTYSLFAWLGNDNWLCPTPALYLPNTGSLLAQHRLSTCPTPALYLPNAHSVHAL